MLSKLVSRLNNDSNKEFEDKILTESINVNSSIIDDVINEDVEILKTALEKTSINNSAPVEINLEKLVETANDPAKAINEAVECTDSKIVMDKESYDALIKSLKDYKGSDESAKKEATKKIKGFIKNINKALRKANDDNPADALIIASINKICTALGVDIKKEDNITEKHYLALKINAISKAI